MAFLLCGLALASRHVECCHATALHSCAGYLASSVLLLLCCINKSNLHGASLLNLQCEERPILGCKSMGHGSAGVASLRCCLSAEEEEEDKDGCIGEAAVMHCGEFSVAVAG